MRVRLANIALLLSALVLSGCAGGGMSLEHRREALIAKGGLRAACTYADSTTLPQYKANFHCHTRRSDGMRFWDEMASWYETHGYGILAITDHDGYGDQDGGTYYPDLQNDQVVHDWNGDGVLHETRVYKSGVEAYVCDYDGEAPYWVPRKWKLNKPGGFVVLNGLESTFGHHHTLCIEPPAGKVPQPREGYQFIDWCHSNGGIVVVAHPSDWNQKPYGILDDAQMRKVDGIEVMNADSARHDASGANADGSLGFAEPLWDACLDAGKRLWGFADDDAHDNLPGHAGGAWNMVWVEELTKPAVMESLRKGAFYASCGIEIDRVEVSVETMFVHTPNATHIKVIGDGGRTLAEVDSNEITYTLEGSEEWIRVVLWNETLCYPDIGSRVTQKAWLQPIMVGELLKD